MTLRDHLQAIYDQHGQLTPVLVKEVARAKDHPLHASVFDKNVKDASEAWYEHRAHELIRKVRISYRDADSGEPRDIRAFHAVRSGEDGGLSYEPLETIADDPLLKKMLLRDAEREWRALRTRYEHLEEFFQIVASDLAVAA